MQQKFFFQLALPLLIGTLLVIGFACHKDNDLKDSHAVVAGKLVKNVLVQTPCDSLVTPLVDSLINTNITTNLTFNSTKRYVLTTQVYVTGNHTLTIEAGTRIVGQVPCTPAAALIVSRGSKIIAIGTASKPIIFTSQNDVAGGTPLSGDWGGLILLGNAPTNVPVTTTVNGVASPGPDAMFGGTDPHDNSGILKYVRVDYAGYVQALNYEINALVLAGVGDGTVIDYVESYKSFTDSFEYYGGTVNTTHLVSVDALDDMFNTNYGYIGTIRYALGVADSTRAAQNQSNGIESANNETGTVSTPITHPTYRYLTIVGVSSAAKASTNTAAPSGTGSYGRGAHFRRNAEFDLDSSIFQGYKYGVSLDDALGTTYNKYVAGVSLTFKLFSQAYANGYVHEAGASVTTWVPRIADADASSVAQYLPSAYGIPRTISRYMPSLVSAAYAYGAFPGGVNWTLGLAGSGCTTQSAWLKL